MCIARINVRRLVGIGHVILAKPWATLTTVARRNHPSEQAIASASVCILALVDKSSWPSIVTWVISSTTATTTTVSIVVAVVAPAAVHVAVVAPAAVHVAVAAAGKAGVAIHWRIAHATVAHATVAHANSVIASA